MSYMFRDQSWPKLRKHIDQGSLVILPIGTTEEHGPHLPVDTDARIVEHYCNSLAEALTPEMPLLVMDTISYGYSMQIMQQWPGTVVVRSRVMMDLVLDICCSIYKMGFKKLALVNVHGHHIALLNQVVREVGDACFAAPALINPMVLARDKFNEIRKSPRGGAIHSGEFETSLILHLSPETVDMSVAVDEMPTHQTEFVAGDGFTGKQQVTWSTWMIDPSESGVYGAPSYADPETGRICMEAAVEAGARFMREFVSTPDNPAGPKGGL